MCWILQSVTQHASAYSLSCLLYLKLLVICLVDREFDDRELTDRELGQRTIEDNYNEGTKTCRVDVQKTILNRMIHSDMIWTYFLTTFLSTTHRLQRRFSTSSEMISTRTRDKDFNDERIDIDKENYIDDDTTRKG